MLVKANKQTNQQLKMLLKEDEEEEDSAQMPSTKTESMFNFHPQPNGS